MPKDIKVLNDGYGSEVIIPVGTHGRTVRCPSYPRKCEYVRVCNADGEEIVYWYVTEFEDDAALTLGALMGAMCSDIDIRV